MRHPGKIAAALAVAFVFGCAHMDSTKTDGALTPEERLELGAIYESKGEDELAIREYRAVSKEDEYNAGAFFALANLYLKRESYDEAEVNYKKAIELNPNDATYRNNLGWLYMERGRFDAARAEVAAAIERDPERKYIYLDTLGVIQTRQGDYNGAEKSLLEAASLAPAEESEGLVQIYTHLAEVYDASGRPAKAGEMRDRAREIRETGGLK